MEISFIHWLVFDKIFKKWHQMERKWCESMVLFVNKKWFGIILFKPQLKIICSFHNGFPFNVFLFLIFFSGVLGIVWHGYSDAELNKWQQRKAALMTVLKRPLGKYVIHSVSFGSEPLFSWSISNTFVMELEKIKGELKALGVPLTVSEVNRSFRLSQSLEHWYLSDRSNTDTILHLLQLEMLSSTTLILFLRIVSRFFYGVVLWNC